ncbi:MAG: Alpha-L-glutamate ligase-like protein [Candidatus Woesebacteria bacterium GW2011_GWA2_40_7b]|uniref:Alpha-L-glutamate ligase-like protein n=1 Tax=Candidatus Woesebacteria bacterium GW2011_GWA2_40_7b TaxID=1618563 RepID=A0A0G0T2T4_9BACT|nr:MAG: Alpha-L-glutamate ligase-like protein [Candidatus Woesebacteria bacterium GW2011_GWA2_40_7b]
MKASSILGLNARTQLFAYKYNTKRGKNIADSKIQTARVLREADVDSLEIYKKFKNPQDVLEFDWNILPDKFALKPSRGMGGEGIVVVKRRLVNKQIWVTTNKERVTVEDLKLHILDILEGAYSMGNVPDVAFIQEYVGRHKAFRRWAYRGTPDIRVIVFNKVPVMAMLRLPTKESGGRANLHQGALGVGIDMATGITTKAIWHGSQIIFKPGTERKLRGIKIPSWNRILETAVKAQITSGLGYLGVDIVLHPEKGPLVLELNAQPGLQIQLANAEGLKKRLERVEDLEVADADHGVMIAKAIFAGRFADRIAVKEGIKMIKNDEEVKIVLPNKHKDKVMAKIDTGAWRSSIDKTYAEKNGLLQKDNILWTKVFKSSLGAEERPVINLSFYLAGRRINTIASVSNRRGLKKIFIIGRRDLQGFLVKVDDRVK